MGLPKVFQKKTETIDISPNTNRFMLVSPEDKTCEFLLQYFKSTKADYKITLHHQENSQICLLVRVDYNSGHRNPDIINENVPDYMKAYCGVQLNESHVHINVEGYRDLAWAVPLNTYDKMSIKQIVSPDQFGLAIIEFAKLINISSKFTTQTSLV